MPLDRGCGKKSYADEDIILGAEVSRGPAATGHTYLGRLLITASDKGFSGANKINHGSYRRKPL